MKSQNRIIVCFVVGLIMTQQVLSQGTFVSNLGEVSGGSVSVGSNLWNAVGFITGANPGGYELSSVQLSMLPSSGNPGSFSVSLYNNSSVPRLFEPASSLGSLAGLNSGAGGVYTYTASSLTLLPNSTYWVVASSTVPVATGSFRWSIASTANYSANAGWFIINAKILNSVDGQSWNHIQSNPLQFAINATAIPEPSSLALFGLGGLCLASRLKGRRQFSFQLFTHEQHRRVLSH